MEDEIDTFLTAKLICPYCGEENEDDSREETGTTCSGCGEKFRFERDYTIRYISAKINRRM